MSAPNDEHWLSRPATLRKLWIGFAIVLGATLAAEAVVYVKGYFAVDAWPGFAAVFGFGSCVVMVLVAKALGVLLKRPDDYYHD